MDSKKSYYGEWCGFVIKYIIETVGLSGMRPASMFRKKQNNIIMIPGLEIFMLEKVKELLEEALQINPDDITMKSELMGDLGINSLELADLVLSCEEKFDIEIKDEDIHKFVTVGDVVNYLSDVVGE